MPIAVIPDTDIRHRLAVNNKDRGLRTLSNRSRSKPSHQAHLLTVNRRFHLSLVHQCRRLQLALNRIHRCRLLSTVAHQPASRQLKLDRTIRQRAHRPDRTTIDQIRFVSLFSFFFSSFSLDCDKQKLFMSLALILIHRHDLRVSS